MIKSMTGYGKSSSHQNQRNYQVEIKSVNHRYLDISVKLPKQLSFLEDIIKKQVSEVIKRGKVDITVTFENNSNEGRNITINKEIAKLYIEQLKQLAEEEQIESNIEVTEIVKYPDVLNIQVNQEDDLLKNELVPIIDESLKLLVEMRKREGNKIAEDLKARIKQIEEKIFIISEKSTGLIQEYVVKLEKRIKEILQSDEIDKSRIAQEVVIYADKCSIEEEITRLRSHIDQFYTILDSEGPAGKRLDFIVQEMNREINTIGSKSNSVEITNGVIDVKTELENVREQIQNIE